VKWRLNILFSIPNSYNCFLLWFYRVFLHVAFLGSGVHQWIVILLVLFVRFKEMLKIFFYLQMINPKICFILKKNFIWVKRDLSWLNNRNDLMWLESEFCNSIDFSENRSLDRCSINFVWVKINSKTKPIAKLIWQLLTLDVNSFSPRKKRKSNNFSSSKVYEDILWNKMGK
jgi:hypothetical protein